MTVVRVSSPFLSEIHCASRWAASGVTAFIITAARGENRVPPATVSHHCSYHAPAQWGCSSHKCLVFLRAEFTLMLQYIVSRVILISVFSLTVE